MISYRRSLLCLVMAATFVGSVAAVDASPAAAAVPARGATVEKPPVLRWHRVSGARFYNVQLYRNGRKLLSRWPRRAQLRLSWAWRQGERRHRFRPGVYRWYVWPHYRHRYGRLRVQSWFRAGRPPRNVTPPGVDGIAQEGALLTASPGRWKGTRPIRLAYRWQRCDSEGQACTDIPGERGSSRLLGAADIDATIRVVVGARNSVGRTSAASRPTSAVLPAAPILVAAPQISGRLQVGQRLTADVGAWSSSRPLTYRLGWELCDKHGCMRGTTSTARTLLLETSALGRTVRVVVSASSAGGSEHAVSQLTARVGRTLLGTGDSDQLVGSAGSDVLVGGNGADELRGRNSPDRLVGGRGFDRLRSGRGDDRIYARDREQDQIRCGGGRDIVLSDRQDRIAESCEVIRSRRWPATAGG
jgi:hypothetical protein